MPASLIRSIWGMKSALSRVSVVLSDRDLEKACQQPWYQMMVLGETFLRYPAFADELIE